MKSFVYLIFVFSSVLFGCGSNNESNNANLIESSSSANNPKGNKDQPVLTFEHDHWDFKNMIEGEVVEHDFTFKNTGGKALLISDVQASCGCTIPEWPRQPIRPGEEGKIKIRFNSNGKADLVEKHVTIISNASEVKKELYFKAFVKKKAEEEN